MENELISDIEHFVSKQFIFKNGIAYPNCELCKHCIIDQSVNYIGCKLDYDDTECIKYQAHDFITTKDCIKEILSDLIYYVPSYPDHISDPFEYHSFCEDHLNTIMTYEKWLSENNI